MKAELRMFPIKDAEVKAIPWRFIKNYEDQVIANHGATLEALAKTGGLTVCQAVAALDLRAWRQVQDEWARVRLMKILYNKRKEEMVWQAKDKSFIVD